MAPPDMLFRLADIHVHYNKVAALKGVTIEVGAGDIVTLIGANGAGKSTTLRAISGLTPPSAGEIWFDGRRIDGLATEKIVQLGIWLENAHLPCDILGDARISAGISRATSLQGRPPCGSRFVRMLISKHF